MKYKNYKTEIERLYYLKYFDRIISLYKEPDFINLYDTNNDGNAYYYASLAYVALGKFDDAIQVLNDCISMYGHTNFKYYSYFYNVLCMIDFYNDDYLNLFYNSLPNVKIESIDSLLTHKILPKVCVNSDIIRENQKYAKKFYFSKDKCIEHVSRRHQSQFKLQINKVYDVILENIDKAPSYYLNFSIVKCFSCVSAGSKKVKESGKTKRSPINFIIVVVSAHNSQCIVTFYPESYIGDMSFYDISKELSNKIINRKKIYSDEGIQRIKKFYNRQNKKK